MVTRPAAETKDLGPAADLSPEDQKKILDSDTADNTVKAEEKELSGKRVRAIPAVITKNGDHGTTVEVRASDFLAKGIEHETVTFDARRDNYTLPVGDGEGQISEKAANFLTKNYPYSFEFMDNGE